MPRPHLPGWVRTRSFLLSVFGWTAAVGFFLIWDLREAGNRAQRFADTAARSILAKDLSYRRWASMHGGVYVPVTEVTPANPYLEGVVEEQNIVTPSGRGLTLVNPAYMTRQVHEMFAETYGGRGHITSLDPIRPENTPDPWERGVLERFEVDPVPVAEAIPGPEGGEYRLMIPLRVEESCMACHAAQGYQVGDIRGGLSASVPMAPYLTAATEAERPHMVVFAIMWILGLVGLAVPARLRDERLRVLEASEAALQAKERSLLEAQRIGRVGHFALEVETGRWTCSALVEDIGGLVHAEVHESAECMALLASEDVDDITDKLRDTIVSGGMLDLEVRITRASDGEERWVWVRGEVEGGYPGQGTRVMGTVQDITRRVVADREREALEARLDQSQRLESIGRLAGGVAHDFNNMMGVVMGHAELALSELADGEPDCGAHLTTILAAARRSAELTRKLLAFSGQQVIRPVALDLNQVVPGMLGMLRRLIREHITLQWNPGADLRPVRMDPTQLDQILANLVVNARDAISEHGTVTLATANVTLDEEDVSDLPELGPGDHVELRVTDTGSGMDARTQERIFEPFFTTKGPEGGSGLGLATVYGIVQQNRGAIFVDSAPGEGTEFRILLPATDEAPAAPGGEREPAPPTRPATILVVEDEESILRLTAEILGRAGHTVIAASSPAEALSRVDGDGAAAVDLLLTDVIMPGMNGRELAERLLERNPALRIVFMSGYSEQVLAREGKLPDGVRVLPKPFTRSSLLSVLAETLREEG